jgi:hypothetical protein
MEILSVERAGAAHCCGADEEVAMIDGGCRQLLSIIGVAVAAVCGGCMMAHVLRRSITAGQGFVEQTRY